jgi:hypothetical protein
MVAARISFALWGGRFNPIIVIDQQGLAQELIDVFRVDVILPLGDSQQVKELAAPEYDYDSAQLLISDIAAKIIDWPRQWGECDWRNVYLARGEMRQYPHAPAHQAFWS